MFQLERVDIRTHEVTVIETGTMNQLSGLCEHMNEGARRVEMGPLDWHAMFRIVPVTPDSVETID